MMMQRLKNEERKYELIQSQSNRDKTFGELINYIKYIFNYLWNNPYIVSEILSYANISDIRNYLAHFFTVNFYENNLTNNSQEGQLLFIITLQLKKELNQINIRNNEINHIEQTFLNNTPCGFIFSELFHKKEIQAFFKPIISDLIEELELSYPSQEIVFNPGLIRDLILLEQKERREAKKKGKEIIKKDEKVIIFGKSNLRKDINITEKLNLFNTKYQFGIQKEQLVKIMNEYKDKNMINYIKNKIAECENNPFLYSTSILLESINFTKMSDSIGESYNDEERREFSKNIFTIYQQSFFETTKILDKLFDNLNANIHLLPNIIKYINKIIFSIIDKINPNLSVFEKNVCVSQFFFNKLLFPMLLNPSIYVLINDFIISDNTIFNITTLMSIINTFVTGKFYKDTKSEGQYTPLNWYFLSKMPKLLEFFEKASNVNLPEYIERLINNDNELDFEFDYFKENKDEKVLSKNILFSFDDFYYLYMNMEEYKDKLLDEKNEKTKILKRAINRLRENEYKIDKIKTMLEKNEENENSSININSKKTTKTFEKEIDEIKPKTLKFFLISDLFFNNNLFNLKSEKEYFNIKEEKNLDKNDKIIIKAKNFICGFLFNYYSLEDIHLSNKNGDKFNTLNILKKLKNYTIISDTLRKEKIPYEWYIDSIIEYLKKLPEKYIQNDYLLLYEELEKDIKNSIKIYNFEEISLLANKIKLLRNIHLYYEDAKKILIDIDLNKRVQIILEKENIPMEIKFVYSPNKKRFKITPISSSISVYFSSFRIFSYYEIKSCRTINQFISIFPDLNEYLKHRDYNILDVIKELDIPKKLEEYFDYIEEHLKQSEKKEEIKDIKIKIYDYVMEKLYDKLYPDDPDEKEFLIFKNCIRGSWVELKHFIRGKDDYILENFIPDTSYYFQQIINEKSPRKKFLFMNKIFSCIHNLGLLNGDKFEGTDEILSILNYALIKNKPLGIYTSCKYMDLFMGDKKNKGEGHQLTQLLGLCHQMMNFNYKCLFDVTEEEFNKNCSQTIDEEIN